MICLYVGTWDELPTPGPCCGFAPDPELPELLALLSMENQLQGKCRLEGALPSLANSLLEAN